MDEKQKAEALSAALDALSRGEETSPPVPDPEIGALTDLARVLDEIEFRLPLTQQAALERLLQTHRRPITEWKTAAIRANSIAAREDNVQNEIASDLDEQGSTNTVQPPVTSKITWSKITRTLSGLRSRHWLLPAGALAGGIALLAIVAFVALTAAGAGWFVFRHVGPAQPTSALIAKGGATPTPRISTAREVALQPSPSVKGPYTVYVPLSTSPIQPGSAMLKDIRGAVQVQMGGEWVPATEKQSIRAGQRIRTAELSSASLAFYEGSVAYLGSNTELSVDNLAEHATDKARIIEMTQWSGDTDHDVQTASSPNARYEVRTPSGVGEAKGTSFHVVVLPTLFSRFIVDEGTVAVTHLEVTVLVIAGQLTTIGVGEVPSEPSFRVTGEGEVTAIGETWEIAGQTFATDETTVIVGNPQVGDWVLVDGYLTEEGDRVADRIVLLRQATADRFSFTGRVDAIEETAWIVAGQAISVTEDTFIEEGIEIDNLVQVEGRIQEDGGLLAEEIHLVEEETGLPFDFVGIVQEIAPEAWIISGISVTVDSETQIDPELAVDDIVQVRGRIQESGEWLARSIERFLDGERTFEFAGTVEGIDPWVVSGISFETRAWTEIDAEIEVGDQVKVTGQIMEENGAWVAAEIELLDDDQTLRFEFIGEVESIDPWVVGGMTITVDAETEILGEIVVGTLVKVEGQILADGTWLATEIKPLAAIVPGEGCLSITALVVGIETGAIELFDGQIVELDDSIVVEGEVVVNSIVTLLICVDDDGSLRVVYILVIHMPEPIVIVTPTPLPAEPAPLEGEKVVVCHKAGGKNPHTITISRSALGAHLGHGDTLGACK